MNSIFNTHADPYIKASDPLWICGLNVQTETRTLGVSISLRCDMPLFTFIVQFSDIDF
jgi:hypothetical protein